MTGARFQFAHAKNGLVALVAAVCVLLTVGPSKAVVVHWTLQNVSFNDGSTATGSYNYDAATNTFSAINITTSPGGSPLSGATYMSVAPPGVGPSPAVPGVNFGFLAPPFDGDATTHEFFGLMLVGAMTDAGGLILILPGLLPFLPYNEGICIDATCTTILNPRTIETGGAVLGTPVSEVPLPGALPLFTTGLGALGLLTWRRKRKQAAA